MAITIKRSSKLSGPSGLLTKQVITDTSIKRIYVPDTETEISYLSVRIVNMSGLETTIKIWIAPKNQQPTMVDTIEPGIVFKPNDIYISDGLSLSGEEALYIQSTQPNVVIRVEGYENILPF